MSRQVYLSGEIHSDWRARIERAAAGLDLEFTAPVTDHAASDAAGTAIFGEQEQAFWNDHLGAGVNAIRTRTLIEGADVVVVRFGEQYRQWNGAFEPQLEGNRVLHGQVDTVRSRPRAARRLRLVEVQGSLTPLL